MNRRHLANMAGRFAGLEPPAPRTVPAEFTDCAEAWLQGYDEVAVALRNGCADSEMAADIAARKAEKTEEVSA